MRVLLLEDDGLVALALQAVLVDAGHEIVATFCRGAEALDALTRRGATLADIAVIDWQLADGLTGAAAFAILHHHGIPCLVITGCTERGLVDTSPAARCLIKPFSAERLLSTLQEVRAASAAMS